MKGTSILIVEDDSNSAFVLKTILEKAGYDILPIVSDGEKALELIEQNHPALILMDISLSGKLDGIQTIVEVHKRYDIPVIYLTGHTSEEIVKRAKATTPYGFILKPYTTQMVLVTTEMAFHKALVERESKETKLRLSVTLGSLASPVFSVLPNKTINYVNTAGVKFLNQPIGKILNKNVDEVLHLLDPEDEKISEHSLPHFDLNNLTETKNHHVIFLNSSGTECHLYIQISVLEDIYNEVQGYVISLNDFTEQFFAEQNNQMLAASLDNSQEGNVVVAVEDDIKILYVNQCFRAIFQKVDEALVNTSLKQFFGKNFNENIIIALQERSTYSADTIITCADDTQKVTNWTLSPFSDNKVAITIRDVTQLRKIEESLRQTQKIEAIGRLASGIAHDFNNLLSVINGCADLAFSSLEERYKLKEYIQSIRSSGEQGAILVKQLMMFSRKEDGKELNETFSSISTIQKTLNMLKSYLGRSIEFTSCLDISLGYIKINPVHFDQILVNLCVNAKDAMPNGGKLSINISNYTGCPKELLKGNFVKIEVKDTGSGMSKEIQKKIFEPFFTTKPIGQGTGIGLASAYGLVKRYNGSIQVESNPGQGTLFTVFIPQGKTEQENNSNQKVQHQGKCCFLDVDKAVSNFLIPCLKKENWKICENRSEATIVISHEKDADVYIPREFCLESKIQHPLAAAQILKEIRRMA